MADVVDLLLMAAAREPHRQTAIARYHALLERQDLSEFAGRLQQEMAEKGALFGDRLLCPFLRPHFIGREQLLLLQDAVRGVIGAMQALSPRLVGSREMQDRLGLTEDERRLAAVDPGYPELSVTSRLDSFLLGGSLRFVEYNAETPAGIAYNDLMMDLFLQTSVMREFTKDYPCQPMYCSDRLLGALIGAYEAWGGRERPVLAVVDYDGLPTRHEFELFRRFFHSRGYDCVVADPRRLEYAGGRLHFEGKTINLVYRRLLTTEFLERESACRPIWEAYRDRAVCFVNSFRAKYLHKKAIFALLTDPQYQEGMTSQQLYSIYTHVPWTRKVEDVRTTDPQGRPIELLAWARRNRKDLILKPNDDYGGRGIFVGWELDESQWDAALATALEHWYLVQTRVNVAREHYPSWEGGSLTLGEYAVDLDPYIFRGRVEGLMTRLSATALCNVTSGGGVVPTFILD